MDVFFQPYHFLIFGLTVQRGKMQILIAIMPVLVLLFLGVLINKFQVIDAHGMEALKTIDINVFIPFVLFHALGTATYDTTAGLILIVMMAVLLISLGIGYLLKPAITPDLRGHFPFLMGGYEGGLIGYPLYIVLMGVGFLHNIATIDIANCIYAWLVLMPLLTVANKGSVTSKEILETAVKATPLYGIVLGIFFGMTGWLPALINSQFGGLYTAIINMLSAPVSALILVYVGYSLKFDQKVLTAALKSVVIRVVTQAILLAGSFAILSRFITDRAMLIGLGLYAFLPPMFLGAIYAKDKENAAYASTSTSLYFVVSITAFVVLAFIK